ncbi:hypothetical protein MTR67_007621 [Solanum verrucosum]|uniref:Uncharacterized protein n=1 Tax=Solanum verrucosum TaxID=315347 RepID=A0AAF0Q075_SOLVR|nr:hypothetical protein MTR67_007621 [Solanum verrucosum]
MGSVSHVEDGKKELVHDVYRMARLGAFLVDSNEGLGVKENLSYEEVSIEILVWQVWKLRNKEVASVKVLWKNQLVEGATWEAEADMRSRYLYIFPSAPTLA